MYDALWSAFVKTGDPFCYLMSKALSGSGENSLPDVEGGVPPD